MIIGLDVGGTHTDVVLLGENGIHRQAKVPTHAHNLLESVRNGIHEVLRGTDPQDIRRAVLSTTLCTNAIVERKLAPVGMIVSGGPGIDPQSFSTGAHYYCVSGSIDHRGREVQPLDAGEIEAIAAKLRKAGLRNIGMVSKFSTRNPHHELQIQEILAQEIIRKLNDDLFGFDRRSCSDGSIPAVRKVWTQQQQFLITNFRNMVSYI